MAVATAAALATAASAAYVASENRKAGKEAAAAIESGRIDPNEVSRLTREQGIQNLRDSIDIESELTPENQQVRRGATRALLPLIGDQGTTEQIAGVEGQIDEGGDAGQSDLLTESIAEARRQLALGGSLDSETRNAVTRRAVARGGNTGKGQFLVPRDLGLTSLQLQQQRLNQGGTFGRLDQTRRQSSFDNLSNLRRLREDLLGNRQQRGLQLANFGQSALAPPDIGLSAGDFGGLFVANQNITAQGGLARAQLRATGAQNTAEAVNAGIGALTPIFDKTK